MKIVVTGATGFVGTALVAKLCERGDHVIALVRNVERAKSLLGDKPQLVAADIEAPGPWCEALEGVDAIVHLAGENVAAKRWDARQKQLIRDSRVESTRTIVEAIGKLATKPRALIAASGVDYYPFASRKHDFDDDEVTESDPPSDSFLGRVCRDWEAEARVAEQHGVRVVSMRMGFPLAKDGFGMDKLARPFRFFVGGKLGSGRQWMSWIHLDDAVAAYIAAIDDARYRGPINLVADSTRNADFARELGKALGRPSLVPAPAFAIKAVVGAEFAESILEGRRVVPAKLRELGFVWRYPRLPEALAAAV